MSQEPVPIMGGTSWGYCYKNRCSKEVINTVLLLLFGRRWMMH